MKKRIEWIFCSPQVVNGTQMNYHWSCDFETIVRTKWVDPMLIRWHKMHYLHDSMQLTIAFWKKRPLKNFQMCFYNKWAIFYIQYIFEQQQLSNKKLNANFENM